MDRIHPTTLAQEVSVAATDGRGTVIADLRCSACQVWTPVLGHHAGDTIARCCSCGEPLAVVDAEKEERWP
jgi:hypothetical protein